MHPADRELIATGASSVAKNASAFARIVRADRGWARKVSAWVSEVHFLHAECILVPFVLPPYFFLSAKNPPAAC